MSFSFHFHLRASAPVTPNLFPRIYITRLGPAVYVAVEFEHRSDDFEVCSTVLGLSEQRKLMQASHDIPLAVRRLSPAEWPQAFPVIAQLRTLDEAEFLRRATRQSFSGYELIGAFMQERVVGVLGMRPVHTLARGAYLHIDDLVVTEEARGSGVGAALLEFAEADARVREMTSVFLDARPQAVSFYEGRDYVLHAAPSMKKML